MILPSRRPGASQAVGEAALAADLITAYKFSRHSCMYILNLPAMRLMSVRRKSVKSAVALTRISNLLLNRMFLWESKKQSEERETGSKRGGMEVGRREGEWR